MVSPRDPLQRHGTWLAEDSQSTFHVEAWRIFTSGQFLHRRVLATDVRDADELRAEDARATGAVALWDVLLYVVEVAELAARMATRLGCETVTFEVSLRGIAGRELISGDHRRHLYGPYLSAANSFSAARTLDVTGLLTDPRTFGVEVRSASCASSASTYRTRFSTTTRMRSSSADRPPGQAPDLGRPMDTPDQPQSHLWCSREAS